MEYDEQYLWVLQYELHGISRLWWAYFSQRAAAAAFQEQIRAWLPCLGSCRLEEQPAGLHVIRDYYHYRYSAQVVAESHRREDLRWRSRWLFPLAPCSCDWLTSFVRSLRGFTPCTRCCFPALPRVRHKLS